jgi:Glycosyl hydrolase family 79 C-terminal beta domain
LNIDYDNISGYAIYEYGQLVRAVFINLSAWLTSDVGNRTRQSTHLNFGFISSSSRKRQAVGFLDVKVQRLAIGFADDTSGLTWDGQSYETADALVTGEPSHETVNWKEGIDIVESEAVLVSF